MTIKGVYVTTGEVEKLTAQQAMTQHRPQILRQTPILNPILSLILSQIPHPIPRQILHLNQTRLPIPLLNQILSLTLSQTPGRRGRLCRRSVTTPTTPQPTTLEPPTRSTARSNSSRKSSLNSSKSQPIITCSAKRLSGSDLAF